MTKFPVAGTWLMAGALCLPMGLLGQTTAPVTAPAATDGQDDGQEAPMPPPKGKVLFSRDGSSVAETVKAAIPEDAKILPEVTDAERDALTVSAYDFDVHLTPASAGLAVRAGMTVRNDGTAPLTRLVLSVSSSLHWESFSGQVAGGQGRLAFLQHTVDTDADHTGKVSEAVVTLPSALAPGASYELAAVYSGTVGRSSVRLDRIGAPAEQARQADWDEIGRDGTSGTSLRGFGEVLWYPVAAAPVFLGDGAKFVQAVGRARYRDQKTTGRLRLAIEYVGEAPHSAYFCGRLEQMTAHSENQNVPVAASPGIATAEFPAETLGFRTLSLFVTEKQETIGEDGLLSAVTEQDEAFKSYEAAARLVQPMLAEWFGAAGPAEPLRIIDHPGQAFEDGSLLVMSMRSADPQALAPAMAQALSHAWMPSRQPWIEEGLAQWMYLMWLERTSGRDAAVSEFQHEAVALAFAEPQADAGGALPAGQSLLDARDEVYYRTKAAAVWWMLRTLVGEDELKQVLQSYRKDAKGSDDPKRLEKALEMKTGKSFAWFFDDWVYADKGLPDLSIVQVTPSALRATGPKGQGWLVAVEVRNDGDAVADVPVTVRSGALTATQRVRVPARSNVSTRILFQKTPEEVLVNDGEVPEMRTSTHSLRITVEPVDTK